MYSFKVVPLRDMTRLFSRGLSRHCTAAAFAPHITDKDRYMAGAVVATLTARLAFAAAANGMARKDKHFILKLRDLQQAMVDLRQPIQMDLSGGHRYSGTITLAEKKRKQAEGGGVPKRQKKAEVESSESEDEAGDEEDEEDAPAADDSDKDE